jgi:hypothetical protein
MEIEDAERQNREPVTSTAITIAFALQTIEI